MSYKTQGVLGLGVGALLALGFRPIGLFLVLISFIMLVFGLANIGEGARPRRCKAWGHDWRRQLPGCPRGTTCRNCLVRKDGAVLAWRAPPPGVPAVFDPMTGLAVPPSVLAATLKRIPIDLYVLDEPRLGRVPYGPMRPGIVGPPTPHGWPGKVSMQGPTPPPPQP
jgi:hypothetical protein